MSRGATWSKWDLHIHTPASYEWAGGKRLRDAVSEDERRALLHDVVQGINDSGCAAVAVMDYWTFDGILALREYQRQADSLKCAATIFPGIELRMVSPGDFRLNMHVLLNPNLSDEKLQAFKSQIRLSISDKPLTDDYLIEWAREHMTESRLAVLNLTKDKVLTDKASALIAASKTVEVTPESVKGALKQFGPNDAILFVPFDTNDGVKKIKFREHHSFPNELLAMEAIYEVGNGGTRDAFVGIETTANAKYYKEFQEAIKMPKLAVRGSDAHRVSDYGKFPNGNVTWIKASPSFEGLLQACKEPANRSFIGALPPKLEFVARNPQLFIDSVRVRKVDGAPELGAWLDGTTLEMNHDLVALIGKKGSGKSALADVMGMLGDTLNSAHFSFLSDKRFRLPKDNKAQSFEAALKWANDTKETQWRSLSSARSLSSVQRVKYLPQRYFEELCNDHVAGDDHLLQSELRGVIYSHIPFEERDGAHSLDDLISRRSNNIEREIAQLRNRLSTMNARILSLADEVTDDAQKALKQSVRLSIVRLRALKKDMPVVQDAPVLNDDKSKDAAQLIESLNTRIQELEEQRRTTEGAVDSLKSRNRAIDEVTEQLGRIERFMTAEQSDLAAKLVPLQIELGQVLKFQVDHTSLKTARAEAESKIEQHKALLDPEIDGSLAATLASARKAKLEQQATLDEPMRLYQEALAKKQLWEAEWQSAVGNAMQPASFSGQWVALRAMGRRRSELAELGEQRMALSIEILRALKQRAALLRDLFAPVQRLIDEEPQIRDALGVRFSVRFTFDSFATRLFDYVKQSVGSFVGAEESRALVQTLLAANDLESEEGLRSFIDATYGKLTSVGRKTIALQSMLKANRTPTELLDFLYGLAYADLSYGLKLDNVELERLSPGQRGALLLIFYLLVDQERIPIILDQPEENLDNETVYQLLVGVITRAKQHRQVIMVTHNANLAVACDAEQIIVCSMLRDGSNQIQYVSGGIEDPHLKRAAVDILEGTKPAFDNRRRKYQ